MSDTSRDTRHFTPILAALLVGAAGLYGSAYAVDHYSWNPWIALPVAVIFGTAVTVTPFFVMERRDAGLRESARRVREAESDLESALRNPVPNSGSQATVPVVGESDRGEISVPADGTPSPSTDGNAAGNSPHLALPELWAVTHSRLDHYHRIATSQAKRSFANAQISMLIGFVLLLVFAGVALNANSTAGSIVAGGLGAVSAGLAGYVSRTFVRSQESAAAHLRAYFDQPLEFSRYLAAERMVRNGDLDTSQRAEVLTALVQAMVAGPQSPPVYVAGQQPGESA